MTKTDRSRKTNRQQYLALSHIDCVNVLDKQDVGHVVSIKNEESMESTDEEVDKVEEVLDQENNIEQLVRKILRFSPLYVLSIRGFRYQAPASDQPGCSSF